MRLVSIRGTRSWDGRRDGASAEPSWSFREALLLGQAPDGGLFVPASVPPMSPRDRRSLIALSFPERAHLVARHLLGDEVPEPVLGDAVFDALNFPIPLREIDPGVHLVELFHGPTHAFKDIGARFMARLMTALAPPALVTPPFAPPHEASDGKTVITSGKPLAHPGDIDRRPLTILTATSGDTGGAVAQAFHGIAGVRVVVLYPRGRVTARQEAQFATLGGNVTAVAVHGTFDDCQRLAREAFADPGDIRLTSANSINIGRLLPQTFYHVHALVEAGALRNAPRVIVSVPSGNLGNLTAGLIARRLLQTPQVRFVASTNANSVLPEYLAGRSFRPRRSVKTISSAMDVGNPSNFHRVTHLLGEWEGPVPRKSPARGSSPTPIDPSLIADPSPIAAPSSVAAASRIVTPSWITASSWTDDETRDCIADLWQRRRIALDPHTAVGLLGLRRAMANEAMAGHTGKSGRACASNHRRRSGLVLATAHPAKFVETVEPIIGETLDMPPGIARVMGKPIRSVRIPPTLTALCEVL